MRNSDRKPIDLTRFRSFLGAIILVLASVTIMGRPLVANIVSEGVSGEPKTVSPVVERKSLDERKVEKPRTKTSSGSEEVSKLQLTDIAAEVPPNLALTDLGETLDRSATAVHVGTVLFNETFDETDDATAGTDNTGGVAWSTTAPGSVAATDYFKVLGGLLEAKDPNSPAASWTTGTINTTGYNTIDISMDLSESGVMEECSDCTTDGVGCIDWVKLEYRVDGGSWLEVTGESCSGLSEAPGEMIQIGDIAGDATNYTTSINSGIGNTIELRISCLNWSATEIWRFDNIEVSGSVGGANPEVDLSVSANSGTEAAATAITVTATAASAVSGDQTVDLGVSGTDITGSDYTLSNTTITILDGQTTGSVTFTIQDDADAEGDETASLTISNPSSGIVLGTTTQNVTITDNDSQACGLTNQTFLGNLTSQVIGDETSGLISSATMHFGSSASGDRRGRVQFLYTAAELNAAGFTGGGKISSLWFRYTFATSPASTVTNLTMKMGCTGLSSLGDGPPTQTIPEDRWDFETGLTQVATYATVAPPAASMFPPTFAWVEFPINEPGMDGFIWDGVNNLLVEFCTPDLQTDKPFFLSASTTSDTQALYLYDFAAGAADGCSYPAGKKSSTRPIVRMDFRSLFPNVSLSVSANSGTEADQTAITVTATTDAAVSGDQTVDLGVTGTGITGTDYNLSNTTITILDGQTTSSVTFTIQDDTDTEDPETATLTISNPSGGVTLGSTTTQNIAITDNDAISCTEVTASVGVQTGTSGTITPFYAGNLGGLQHSTRRQYIYTAAELNAAGIFGGEIRQFSFDFTSTSPTTFADIEIKMGSTTRNSWVDPEDEYITGLQTVMNTASYTVSSAGFKDFVLDTPFNWDGTSNIVIEFCSGTLIGGNGTDNVARVSVETTTNQMTLFLNQNNFTPGNACDATTGARSTARPVIQIVSCETSVGVELSVSANTGTEAAGTTITVTATAAAAVSGDQTIDLDVSGTGITGTDYSLSNTTITILDGQTTGSVTFTIQDDADTEGTETATLTISNPSAELTLGATASQDIAITDDDFPTVELSVSANAGTEAAQTAITVTATASAAVTGDQTLDLGVSGTGITGTDYALNGATITILDGETTGTVTFTVQDDADIEGTETATLTMSNPSAGLTLGTTTIQNITITDNDSGGSSTSYVNLPSTENTPGNNQRGIMFNITTTNEITINSFDHTLAGSTPVTFEIYYRSGGFSGSESTPGDWTLVGSVAGLNPNNNNPTSTELTSIPIPIDLTIPAGQTYGFYLTFTSIEGFVTYSNGSSTNDLLANDANLEVRGGVAIDYPFILSASNRLSSVVVHYNTEGDPTVLSTLTSADAANVQETSADLGGEITSGGGFTVSERGVVYAQTTTNANPQIGGTGVLQNDNGTGLGVFNETITGLMPGTQYSYTSYAINGLGTNYGGVKTFTTTISAQEVNLSVLANAGTEAAGTVITVTATAASAVSGDQTVDLGVSGTGITGADYTLSSSTITILDGQTTGTATFTIQSDAANEVAETATIAISNPSTGLTLGTNTTEDILITDEDCSASGVYTRGTSELQVIATSPYWVFIIGNRSIRRQYIITAAELNEIGISGAGLITALDLNFASANTSPVEGLVMKMGTTSQNFYTAGTTSSTGSYINGLTTVIGVGNIPNTATVGWHTFTLDNPFVWDGSSNLVIEFVSDTFNSSGTSSTIDLENTDNTMSLYSESASTVGTAQTTGNAAANRPIMRFTLCGAPDVNLSASANIGTEADGTVITVTATVSAEVSGDQTIDLGVSGTGITNTDYNLSATTLTILDGETTGTATFTILSDADVEGTETATLTISNPSAGIGLGATTSQGIAITDDVNAAPLINTQDATLSSDNATDITFNSGNSNLISITDTDGDSQSVTIAVTGGGNFTLSGTTNLTVSGDGTSNLTFSGPLVDVNNALNNAVFSASSTVGQHVIAIRTDDGEGVIGPSNITLGIYPSTSTLTTETFESFTNNDPDFTNAATNQTFTFTASAFGVTEFTSLGLGGSDFIVDNLGNCNSSNNLTGSFLVANSQVVYIKSLWLFPSEDCSSVGTNGTITIRGKNASTTLFTKVIASGDLNTQQSVNQGFTFIGLDENAGFAIDELEFETSGSISYVAVDDFEFVADSFAPTVDLSVSASTGTEAAQTAITVTATAAQAVTGDQTVDLGVSGTGITGSDYSLSNATITILDGQTTGTVTFTIQDDADIEGTETATLTISNPSAGVILGTTTTQNVAITDNDFPTVDLSVSANAGTEAAQTVITVTATASQSVDGDQTVDLGVSGTGIANTDYALSNTTITILDGATTGTVTFTVQDDADIEGAETATLTISNPSAGVTLGTTTTQNVTITDNDFPSVGLSVSANTGTELDQTVITVTATASQAVDGDQTVDLGVSGTGIANTDYALSNATITIFNGQSTGTVTFTVQDDADIEGAETATLTISNPSAGVSLGTTTTQNVTITDNDYPTVDLSVSANAGTEAAGTVITFTATASQAVDGDQTVDLGVSGTGIANTDYALSNTTITILDGATTGTVTFTVQDDADIEGAETATLTISNPSAGVTLGTTTTQNVTITDNDFPSVGLSVSANTGTEVDQTVITVTATASQAVDGDQTVDLGVSGTGIANTDYSLSNTTITILDSQTTGTVTFTIQDDADIEGTETATLTISNPSAGVSLGTTTTQNVNITDNDFPTVELSVSANVGTEAAQTVITVTATASQAVDGDQTVDLGVSGTGTANTDYALSNVTITILDGATTGMVTFTVQDDADIEGTETATLTVSNPSAGLTLGTTTTQNIAITDNDFPTVDLSVSASAGTEAAGTVITVTATASQAVDGDQTVDLGVSGTGIANTDYALSNTTITILDGQTTGTVIFTVQDDADIEGTETATLTISNPSAGVTLGTTTTQNVAITDDDFPTVDLSVSANTGRETTSTAITVTVTASQSVDGDQTVDLLVSGTDITGTDYALSSTTITIFNGQTSGTVTFTVQDDFDVEGTETAILTISNPSAGMALGVTTTQNIAITDNDFYQVDLSVSANTGAEATGTVITATATTSGTRNVNQTVDIGVSGTGITGTDYVLSNTTITIPSGQTTGAVTFTVQDDTDIEGTETATLALNNPSEGLSIGSSTRNIAITDNDIAGFTIVESDGTSIVSESGTTDDFTVVLNAQPASDVVIDLSSADVGEVTVSPSTLTFTNANWNTPQTIIVTGVDDNLSDGDQVTLVTVTINDGSSDDAYDPLADQTVSVTTTDDDFPTVDLSVSTNTGTEAAQTVITVTATASAAVTGDQTIDLGVNGTGITGTDYILSNATITILNGQTTGSVTFTIRDDADIEGTETATLTISNPSAGVSLGTTTTQNVNITDNDFPTVELSVSANAGTEAAQTVITVTATASQAVDGDQTVDLGVSGTATANTDYALSNVTITILDGATTGMVTFTVQDDADIEGDETATLTISNPSAGVTLGTTTTQNVAITDNDIPGFTIVESDGTSIVSESGTTDDFTVVLDAQPTSDVVIAISSADINEVTVSQSAVTFTSANWNVPQIITVTGIDDNLSDGDQTTLVTLTINDGGSDDAFDAVVDQNVSVTTTDNDSAGFTIVESDGDTEVSESGTTDDFTVVLNAQPASDVVIDLSSADVGEAPVSPTNLTFTNANWNTPQTVTITGIDDNVIDGDQNTLVTLTVNDASSDDLFDVLPDQTVTVTTLDDDFPTVELGVDANVGTEAAGTVITVTATASQAVSGDQTVDVGISGTSIAGTDYILSATSITILNGATTGTVTFTIQDDADIEGTETALLTISNPSAGVTLGANTSEGITITDNDFPSVELSVSANAGTEAASTVIAVTVTASQAVTGDQTVNLAVTGTGIMGTDYTLSGTSITILNGTTTGTATFTIQDDADIEGTETATLTISNPSAGLTLGTNLSENITITDDDFAVIPSVELSVDANAGTEATGTVITVTATASQGVTGDQAIDLGVSGAGITNTDYTLSNATITILNGQTTGSVTFTIQDDADIEGTETALLTISNPSAGVTLGANTSEGITITDNDFPSVELSVSANAGTEAASTVITVTATASQAVSGDQTVDIGVSGTGIANSDYVLSNTSIMILNGQTTGSVTFTIQDDADIEGTETALLTISNPSAGVTLGANTSEGITITDNDITGFTIAESDGVSIVSESGTTDGFTVVLDAQPLSDVVIDISSADVGETTVSPSSVTFTNANWNTPQTVIVTGVDDNLSDGDQVTLVTLTVNDAASDDQYDAVIDQTVSVTTTDNDSAGFTIVESDGTSVVSESGTTDDFTVVLNAQPASDVVIDLSSADVGEVTVSPANLSFTNANWNTPQTVTIIGIDDNVIDGDQNTLVTLTVNDASSDDLFDVLADQSVTVTTLDNDFPTVELSVDANVGTEAAGTVITVTATASQAVSGDQTVDLGVSGTGITNADYTLSNTSITILNGQTTGSVTFTIQDDADIEGTETATLTISNSSAGVTLGTNLSENITITDDDFAVIPSVELSVDANAGTEATGTVITVTATASQGVTGDQTIDLGVSGTGITNADYTLSNTSITILNGQTTGSVTFTIRDDADIEGTETATLTISNPSAGVSLGTTTTQNVNITDNDFPTVELSVSANAGTEAAQTVITVTATASQAVDGDQTVDLGVSGTGTANTDYALSNVTITILDGATTGMVTFTVQDDADIEGDETATLTISNPSAGVTLGTTTTQNVAITDNDIPGFTIVESDGTSIVSESGTTDDFTVVLDAQPTSDVVIAISSADINEVTVSQSAVTFTSANWNVPQIITVTGIDDNLSDGDQTTLVTLTINDGGSDDAFDAVVDQNVSVTTTDNDSAGFTIVESDGDTEVSESGTTDDFTVVLNAQPASDVVIDLSSADVGEAPVSPTNLTFTNANWNTPQTVTITGIDDNVIDGDQNTLVTLTVNDASSDDLFDVLPDQTVTVTTLDDDFPTVELGVDANVGTEAAGTVITVTATASQAVSGDQTVDVGISGTSIAGTDYILSATSITILNGATTGTVTFTIQDDADIEGTETALLTISNPSAGVTLGANTSEGITITDNDFPSVELSVSANAGTEAASTVIAVTVTASQAVTGDQTVNLAVTGTGIMGTDYTLSGTSITILNGATTGTVTFTVQDDTDIEGTETATLTISNPSAGLTLGTNLSENITITDDDFAVIPSVELSVDANAGTEATGTVITVTATASQGVTGDQAIDLGVSGTGITNADYTLSNTSITILNGQTTSSVTFTIQDDADIEGTETATLTISNPSAGVTLGANTSEGITITDNDITGFTIAESDGVSIVSESGTTDGFTVVLDAQPLSDVVIDISSADVGETTISPSSVTFTNANWNTPQTVIVTGVDDNLSDGDQVTLVTLTINDAGSDDQYDGVIDQAVSVTTTDNDSAGFTIVESDGDTEVSESGTTDDFTVVLNAQPASDVVIDLSSADVGEVTVSPASLSFTNANWNTPQTVTITGIDDNVIDGDQNTLVTLTVNDASSDDLFDVLPDQTVTVTTLDDDFPIVELGVDANVGTEAAGTVITVTATASQAVSGDQTVDLGVSGTGITNTDYTLSNATITILNGQTTGSVTFTIRDDADIEGTETATLTISNPSAGLTLGTNLSENITITDDDFAVIPSVELSVSANAGTEAASTVIAVTATASQAVTGDQTVNLAVTGTGIMGTDYTLSGTSITILNGATTGTVTFTIQDDADIEGTETATLTISNPSAGLTLGTNLSENVTITDDDFAVIPSVELSVSANAGTEAASTVIAVTATASQAVTGDQTVNLAVTGTGIMGTDYTLSGTSITILNGATTGTATFTIQDDADIEGTEIATLTISDPSSGLTLGTTTTQNITITDDDFPTVDLSVSANEGTEAASTVITVTATASQAVTGDQTVNLAVTGTGITGTDYTLSGTAITILTGATTGTVTFTVQDDSDIEGTETATLTINNPSAGLTLGINTSEEITITDDDEVNPDLDNITIVASPLSQVANGTSVSVIAVQLVDADGNFLTRSGGTVTLVTTGSALLAPVVDNNDGTYVADLTNMVAETVMITGQIEGEDISDGAEVEFIPDNTDSDGDGIFDRLEDLNGNGDLEDDDTDNDLTPNYLDPDDDGDSIPTREEDLDNDGDPQNDDTDNDQIPNYLDSDDDGDGIPTIEEDANNNFNLFDDDTDRDGLINYLDPVENMVPDKLFSPNNDGINDVFQIRDIEKFPNNKVSIFNRAGNLIYELERYDNNQRGWNGIPNKGFLVSGDGIVPNGTYFYVIEPNDGSETITGFFVLKR